MTRMKRLTLGSGLLILAAVTTLLSCQSVPPIDADYGSEAGRYAALVEVPFLTNRAIEGRGEGRYFGNRLGELTGGRCVVGTSADDAEGDLIGVSAADFAATIASLQPEANGRLIVYIHGYYEDFERSCRRAATFKRRLGVNSGLLLFTWPANSTPLTYSADVNDLNATVPVFLQALDQLGEVFGRGNISVIGHSLGARGVVNALKSLPDPEDRFRDLVLIAGDLDRDLFIEALPTLRRLNEQVSVLVSDRDYALMVSETVNGAPRLGQSDAGVLQADGVSVIDVTQIANTHLSGHVYHLRNEAVVAVIRRVLERRPQPPQL